MADSTTVYCFVCSVCLSRRLTAVAKSNLQAVGRCYPALCRVQNVSRTSNGDSHPQRHSMAARIGCRSRYRTLVRANWNRRRYLPKSAAAFDGVGGNEEVRRRICCFHHGELSGRTHRLLGKVTVVARRHRVACCRSSWWWTNRV